MHGRALALLIYKGAGIKKMAKGNTFYAEKGAFSKFLKKNKKI